MKRPALITKHRWAKMGMAASGKAKTRFGWKFKCSTCGSGSPTMANHHRFAGGFIHEVRIPI